MKTVKNLTTSPQEIHYADGSAEVIGIGGGAEIDESRIYPEELVRMKNFFEFSEKKKSEPVKILKKEPDSGITKFDKKIERAREKFEEYNKQGGTE